MEKTSVYHKKKNSVGIEYVNRINGNRLSKPDQSQQSGLVNCIGRLGILTWTGIGPFYRFTKSFLRSAKIVKHVIAFVENTIFK